MLVNVDGIIINASQGGETLISKGGDNSDSDEQINGLMGLNPRDIESIEVLKDASATAISAHWPTIRVASSPPAATIPW